MNMKKGYISVEEFKKDADMFGLPIKRPSKKQVGQSVGHIVSTRPIVNFKKLGDK